MIHFINWIVLLEFCLELFIVIGLDLAIEYLISLTQIIIMQSICEEKNIKKIFSQFLNQNL
jgi:hypothetical protein